MVGTMTHSVTTQPTDLTPQSRRGRRWWKVVLIGLISLLLLLLVVDRVALWGAERQLVTVAEDAAQRNDTTAEDTSVKLHGFPFLTQVASGNFTGATVTMRNITVRDLAIGRATIRSLVVNFDTVNVPRDVIFGAEPHDVTAQKVNGTARITPTELARLANSSGYITGLNLKNEEGKLRASLPLRYAGVTITAFATISAQIRNNKVWLKPSNVSVSNFSISDTIVAAVTDYFNHPITVPKLPYGLTLQDIDISNGSVALKAKADDVSLVE
jgi:hypothetical protein